MSTSGMWDIFIGDTGTQATSYQHEKNLVDLSAEPWVEKLTDTGKEFVTHSDGKDVYKRQRRHSLVLPYIVNDTEDRIWKGRFTG